MQALVHLVDVDEVTVHRITATECTLLPLHLVVHVVRMVLTHVVLPARGTSGRTGHGIVDTILKTHRATVLQTVVGDDIVTKHIHILLNRRTQILHQILTVLDEVGIDIILQTSDTVIVLNQASASSLLHDVQHVLTVAHAIQHTGEGTQILSHTRGVEQVGVETLKFVHDGTDILDTVGELNAHTFLNHTYQCVAVLHGSQIVQTIGESQRLGIGHAFPHLLNGTMDVAQVRIDMLHGLTVEHRLKAKHTMGGGVLRTDVDHIVIRTEQLVLLALQVTILVKVELQTVVGLYIVLKRIAVVKLPVLTERIALEITAEEEAAHIRMPKEHDTVEVIDLALQQIGYTPDVRNGGDIRNHLSLQLAGAVARHAVATDLLPGNHLYRATLMRLGILQNVDAT